MEMAGPNNDQSPTPTDKCNLGVWPRHPQVLKAPQVILRPREGEALSEGAAVCTWNGKQKGSRLVLVGV